MSLALVEAPAQQQLEVASRLADLRHRLEHPSVDVQDALDVRDQAETLRAYATSAKLGLDTANAAVELKLRAERRAGSLLRTLLGTRKSLPNGVLTSAGITSQQASEWVSLSQLPEPEFEQRVSATRSAGRLLSVAAFVRASRQFLRQPGTGGNGRTTPTLGKLRKALELLREVHTISTPHELELARAVVAIGESWAVVLEPPTARAVGVEREICCLLCGRLRPSSKPPKCLACGGSWYQ